MVHDDSLVLDDSVIVVVHMLGPQAADVDSICLSHLEHERCLAVALCVHRLLPLLQGDSPNEQSSTMNQRNLF